MSVTIRMSMCASIFLLIGTGIERYLAVCRPHHYQQVTIDLYNEISKKKKIRGKFWLTININFWNTKRIFVVVTKQLCIFQFPEFPVVLAVYTLAQIPFFFLFLSLLPPPGPGSRRGRGSAPLHPSPSHSAPGANLQPDTLMNFQSKRIV